MESVNAKDRHGHTPLINAAKEGQKDFIIDLLPVNTASRLKAGVTRPCLAVYAYLIRPPTQRASPHRQLLWHDGGGSEAST